MTGVHELTQAQRIEPSIGFTTKGVLERVFVLACCAVLCSFVVGILALHAFLQGLPSSDAMYGQSVWVGLRDPTVLLVWLQLTLLLALLALWLSLLTLWKVSLLKAVPTVVGATVASAAVGMVWLGPWLGVLLSLSGGIVAMLWSRGQQSWRI